MPVRTLRVHVSFLLAIMVGTWEKSGTGANGRVGESQREFPLSSFLLKAVPLG